MIFAIDEDGGLLVFESEAELRRELEGIDVVSDVYSLYGDDGVALVVVQDPSQLREGWRKVILGPSSAYSLRMATESDNQPDLFAVQAEARYLNQNAHFQSIGEVMNYARSRRGNSV